MSGRTNLSLSLLCALLLLAPLARGQNPPSRVILGSVHDTQGSAIAGATITALAGQPLREIAVTQSSAKGEFVLRGLPNAIIHLRVTAPGFRPRGESVEPSQSSLAPILLRLAVSSQTVVVTATRTPMLARNQPADVSSIGRQRLRRQPGMAADDALRQAIGFSLFRRSDSLAANPTAQGVSFRGLGGTAASRVLVLYNGVPLNDAFGGWVQWDRIPMIGLQSVEAVRGGLSDLYGGPALAGVINLRPRQPSANALDLDLSAGTVAHPEGAIFSSVQLPRHWSLSGALQQLDSPGYFLVLPPDRGSVDHPASLDFTSGTVLLGGPLNSWSHLFFQANLLGEKRNNGTLLQLNSTHLAQFALALDAGTAASGAFALRLYNSSERYQQDFSAIAVDRNSERLTDAQWVPSTAMGGSLQWDRPIGAHHLVVGLDQQQVRGDSRETIYAGAPLRYQDAGGSTVTTGAFAEDYMTIGSRLLLSFSAREDYWLNQNGMELVQQFRSPTTPSGQLFSNRSESSFSPGAGLLLHLTPHLAWTGSAYRSFRAPTLNELYRAFRVGNILTNANPLLTAERLTGGETGLRWEAGASSASAVLFAARLNDPISNATLSVTPALITRQRQNLGADLARGVELQAERRWRRLFLQAGYQFVRSTVAADPANPLVVGRWLPEVPAHSFTFSGAWEPARTWTLELQSRASSRAFEDDLNQLPLNGYITLDGYLSHHLRPRLELFAAGENLTGERYMVGRTPVASWGPPLLLRAGLKLHLGAS